MKSREGILHFQFNKAAINNLDKRQMFQDCIYGKARGYIQMTSYIVSTSSSIYACVNIIINGSFVFLFTVNRISGLFIFRPYYYVNECAK